MIDTQSGNAFGIYTETAQRESTFTIVKVGGGGADGGMRGSLVLITTSKRQWLTIVAERSARYLSYNFQWSCGQ